MPEILTSRVWVPPPQVSVHSVQGVANQVPVHTSVPSHICSFGYLKNVWFWKYSTTMIFKYLCMYYNKKSLMKEIVCSSIYLISSLQTDSSSKMVIVELSSLVAQYTFLVCIPVTFVHFDVQTLHWVAIQKFSHT